MNRHIKCALNFSWNLLFIICLTAGVILIVGAFSFIIFNWSPVLKNIIGIGLIIFFIVMFIYSAYEKTKQEDNCN